MDFGTRLAFDGHASPPTNVLRSAFWFERSSGDRRSVVDRGIAECNTLLDRLREAGGLVYSDDDVDDEDEL